MFSEITRRLGARPIMTLVAVLLSLFLALLGLAPSIYATQIMGRFISHGRTETLVAMLVGLTIALLGELLLRIVRYRVLSAVSAEADEELAIRLFQRSSENDQMRGVILLESVAATYSAGRVAALMDLPTAALYIGALWWISADIGAVVCISTVLAVLFDFAIGRVNSVASVAGNVARNKIATSTTADLRGAAISEWVDESMRVGQIAAAREGTISLSNSIVYSAVLTVGAVLVVSDNLSPSALFGAGLLGARAGAIALRLGGLMTDLKRGQPAMESVVRILNTPPPVAAAQQQFLDDRRASVLNSAA